MTEMERTVAAAMALAALAVTLAVVGPAGGVAPASEANATSGETLAGALASHGSDLQGDLDRRALSAALADANDTSAAAAVLADRRLRTERRARALADRREQLEADRAAGDLAPSAYRVERKRLAARTDALQAFLDAVEAESQGLPADLRSAYGLDADALNRSRTRVAAARGDAPDADATRPSDADLASARNATEREVADVERRQAELESLIESMAANETDGTALSCSRNRLETSRTATDRARDALAEDDDVAAEASLVEGSTALRGAYQCLVGLPGYEAPSTDGDFERSDYDLNDSTYDEPTWNESEYDRDSYDENWTATRTPTPTPTYDGNWSWDGKSTDSASHEFETPTPSDS